MKARGWLFLILLTFAALLIHGYHPWAEDAEIYLPGAEKLLNPHLFAFNTQFFENHGSSTLFPHLIAWSVRLTHMSMAAVLFAWHLLTIFLFLLACYQLAARCFTTPEARWAGVSLVAALLTIPIAGTALYILDQYVNPRNLSAVPAIFAIVATLDRKYVRAGLFLVLAAAIHPLMAVFAIFYCGLLLMFRGPRLQILTLAALAPFGLTLDAPPKAYHLVALIHPFHYITRWQWYEWLGAIAPFAILWWFSRIAKARGWDNLRLLCRVLVIYEAICIPPAIVLSSFSRLEALARVQPMRSLFLLYILMFLFVGGLLGEFVLQRHVWRWLALFIPLSTGMCIAQLDLFEASAHIEWPWTSQKNQWVQAFDWVRENTPEDAIFAIDPDHMNLPDEDEQGFRAVAQRSRLADNVKDAGATSMFPAMADEWYRQVQAQSGWTNFQADDFRRLRATYGVSWVILHQPNRTTLKCPYQNPVVLVCRVPQENF